MTNHEITTFLGTLQDQVAGESLAKLSAISTSISLPKGTTLILHFGQRQCQSLPLE
jgi:hypothetical protein